MVLNALDKESNAVSLGETERASLTLSSRSPLIIQQEVLPHLEPCKP